MKNGESGYNSLNSSFSSDTKTTTSLLPTTNNFTNFNHVMAMPDLTNNVLKTRPVRKHDSPANPGNRLPDLTANTGFGGFSAAKELKTGSVMDILGKK
jgi:hypothetical protein